MAKDPAFLFYSSDFLTGTMFMTMEEKGQYITILCLLHQHGGCLPLDKLEKAVGKLSTPTLEKLSKNQHGYFNIRLTQEIEKRRNYSISRHNNRLGKKHKNKICKTYVKDKTTHMENENEDENKDVNIDKDKNDNKGIVKGIIDDLNLVLGTSYKPNGKATRDAIQARLNEGFTVDDFKTVHRNMAQAWGADSKMAKFLRPYTLYSPKFESYLNIKNTTLKVSDKTVKSMQAIKNWTKESEVIDVKQN